ncbi:hypothetical protein [Streptomyces luteolus]|uniref:PE domain-containing protein n=1 Tax=Streptomyces luteolus TaxID=3043615 RepID=A0ABT6T0X6_9ACTN|nr:hypothetical protein [Streptomyces sp. B-S-A12]MDI3421043.1 hypothetical protein [Streptomyces sp. B-S-A12]
MYSTPDGSKTLTAALNYVDDAALSMAAAFHQATQRLVEEVFGGGGQAGAAGEAGGQAGAAGEAGGAGGAADSAP